MKNFNINMHLSALLLIVLTVLSVFISQARVDVSVLAVVATLFVVIKGQQIIDVFMELYNAPTRWRWLLLSYTILIPIILSLITFS